MVLVQHSTAGGSCKERCLHWALPGTSKHPRLLTAEQFGIPALSSSGSIGQTAHAAAGALQAAQQLHESSSSLWVDNSTSLTQAITAPRAPPGLLMTPSCPAESPSPGAAGWPLPARPAASLRHQAALPRRTKPRASATSHWPECTARSQPAGHPGVGSGSLGCCSELHGGCSSSNGCTASRSEACSAALSIDSQRPEHHPQAAHSRHGCA